MRSNRIFIYAGLLILISTCKNNKDTYIESIPDIIQYVNPFIGTSGNENRDEGRTHPGAQVPFGMISVCPFNAFDTTITPDMWNRKRFQAPYFYDRTHISGFSHVNISGVGCPDMGAILIMPTNGELQTDPVKYFSKYEDEKATPGYYSTKLSRYGIKAEMTATCRTGISKYTFPEGKSNILINFGLAQTNIHGGYIKILSETKVEGFKNTGFFCGSNTAQTVYFAIEFSKPANIKGVWNDSRKFENYSKEMVGNNIGAFFTFQSQKDDVIQVKIGISYVSTENAWLNLESEQEGFDFEGIHEKATQLWNKELSKIIVEGGTENDKILFYTGIYHTLIHPSILNDVNGEYPAMTTHKTAKADGYNRYSVFSLWDTYRNLHQFLTLVYPERQLDMIKSMLAMYKEGGWLPKWELASNETYVMVGDPAIPVIADSYLKGINQFDEELAYEAMKKSATSPEEMNVIRPGIDAYIKYGYIPMNEENKRYVWGPVSTTLEYNIADYSLSRMAEELGKEDDALLFYNRSLSYKNFFDQQTKFLRPKLKDGSWFELFDPTCCEGYPGGPGFVEGNSWQYSFFVPQDIPGLIDLYGSQINFMVKLQQCFDEKHFSMGNEPDIAYPFLFNYVENEEWRTQKEVRKAIYNNFESIPAGLPGNDDCGTMSAWLVFAMMGFYPDCPANTNYQITSPVFDKITIKLNQDFYKGNEFIISSFNNSKDNIYIDSMKLNKKSYNLFSIDHKDITDGGHLEFYLTNKK